MTEIPRPPDAGGQAVADAEPEAAGQDTQTVVCIMHDNVVPCDRCAAEDEAFVLFLRGQIRVSDLLIERVAAAQTAVTTLARHIAHEEKNDDLWEIGPAELADAAAEIQSAATALRRVRRIADLFGMKAREDLAGRQPAPPAADKGGEPRA